MASHRTRETMQGGTRECVWQRVRQLALQGSSVEQRDLAVSQAVTRCQWWLVSQLVQLGVSQRHRDLAVNTAFRYCLRNFATELVAIGDNEEAGRQLPPTAATERGVWELVFTALDLGVDRQSLIRVLREEGCREMWQQAPCLVRQHNTPRLTNFVLQAAMGCCKWDFVEQLVRQGLRPTQQRLVCREALDWGHWHCALELRCQGCEPACAHSVVLEAFRRNRLQDLAAVLREGGVQPGVTALVLSTLHRHLATLGETGVTEKETADLVTLALLTADARLILRLLSLFARTRRVFKQLLLTTRFADRDITSLHTLLVDHHPRLAFHMLVAQEMWDGVLGVLPDSRLSVRERRFAVRHAVHKSAWGFVEGMLSSSLLSRAERRLAFLHAARQGSWRLALRLSEDSRAVSVRDKLFALRTWLGCGLWDCAEDVVAHWTPGPAHLFASTEADLGSKLFQCLVEEAIHADKVISFGEVFRWENSDTIASKVFRQAIRLCQYSYVVQYCRRRENTRDSLAAVEMAIASKSWDLLKQLMQETPRCIGRSSAEDTTTVSLFHVCVSAVCTDETSWPVVVPAINQFCGRFTTSDARSHDFQKGTFHTDESDRVQRLTAWCFQQSYGNAGLCLHVLAGGDEKLPQAVSRLWYGISSGCSRFCLAVAVIKCNWDLAVSFSDCCTQAFMRRMVIGLQSALDYTVFNDTRREVDPCTWAVYCAVCRRNWAHIRANIASCQSTAVLHFALKTASAAGRWSLVQEHLHRGSGDPALLRKILLRALRKGLADVSALLISTIDPLSASLSARSIVYKAAKSPTNREALVKVCIAAGLSTHVTSCRCPSRSRCCVCRYPPLKTALRKGRMSLAKLLYGTGACSNRQLFLWKRNANFRNHLQGQGQGHGDILEYLDHLATTPRTLQDLCRLRVSHLIGCHPGHQDRIESLNVPSLVKNFLRFEDVLS